MQTLRDRGHAGLSDYVDRAWRTYRKPNGKYGKGVSGFIEAVIDEYRRRST